MAQKKQNTELKAAIATWAAMMLFVVFALIYIKSGKEHPVKHYPAVESVVGEDGRAAVGSAEYYEVFISRSLNWELGKGKEWRWFGAIGLLAVGGIFVAQALGYVHFEKFTRVVWVGLAVSLGGLIGAYSSSLEANKVKMTPQEYNRVKDNKAELEKIFRAKEFVRG